MLQQRFLHLTSALVIVVALTAVTVVSTSAASAPAQGGTQHPAALVALAGARPLQASAASSRQLLRGTAPAVSREVFGFGLASSLSDPTIGYPSWNFSLLSTVAFFGLHINWDGTIVADSGLNVWNSSTLTSLLSTAHSSGTKVVVTIVLQDFQAGTPNMCAGLINRAITVKQTVAQVTAKGVDGVNVDYEGLNGTCQNGQTAQAMMTDFASQLRAALPAGSYLSVDTYASSAADSLGFFDIPGLNAFVDSFFVMAYDLEYSNYLRAPVSCSSFCLGPTAPLTGYYYNDTSTASQYIATVPASKVILGVPYYGRKSCVGSVVPNAYPNGSVTADSYLDASTESTDPGVQAGSYAAHRDANDPAGQERWDTWTNPSLGCIRELYWDDATSLGAKYDLVNSDGLRGVGIWTLNYGGGAPELWSALSSRFAKCASATVSPSNSSFPAGSTGTYTATSTGCPNPRYEFFVQYPDGTWNLKQGWGGGTFNWNTTGLAPGVYTIHAWANVVGGGHDSIGSASVTLTGCTAASLSPPNTSQTTGSTIAFTAGSVGCPNPIYEFWVQSPNGPWTLKQGWGGSSFTWDTAGVAPGVYTVHAWANQQGAAPTLEVYGSSTVTISARCASADLNPSSASIPTGGSLALTASSTGCPNPRYEFFVQYPDGSWNLKQGWGGATFNWNTTGLTDGVYLVHSWVNSTGTGHDAIGSATVTLMTRCTSASLSPASPNQPAGSTFALTAASTGCISPQYEFWVQSPDGTWSLKQGWGGATFNWATSGLAPGAYTVHAWVNRTGTTWEAIGSASVTLSGCTSASLSPSSTIQPAGSRVAFTASSGGCPNPAYEFWVQYPDGTWNLKQGWGGPTFNWDTSVLAPGVYTVHAWANQNGAAPTLEVYGSSTVTLFAPCTAASVSPSTGSAAVGTPIAFTVSSGGCPNPVYEFFLLDPAGTWHLMQAFGTGNSWQWNSTGWAKGTYTIHAWANQQGADPTTHEAIGSATYSLT